MTSGFEAPDFRDDVVTIDQAYLIAWAAGSAAVGEEAQRIEQLQATRNYIDHMFGKVFEQIDYIGADPRNETSTIRVGLFMDPLDAGVTRLNALEAMQTFLSPDESREYHSLKRLSRYIEQAHKSIQKA